MSVCEICGGHGSVTIVEKISCGGGCCEAFRNGIGMKITKGQDPEKCPNGDAAKHAAIGICSACARQRVRRLPTEFPEGYEHRPTVYKTVVPPASSPPRSSSVAHTSAPKTHTRSL